MFANSSCQRPSSWVTDKLGFAMIPGLQAGKCSLTVEAEGFSGYQTPLTLGETAALPAPRGRFRFPLS
jgi:hypothetical protein